MTVSSNIGAVIGEIHGRMLSIQNTVLREIAVSMHPVVRNRIHTEGIAADGSQIGTYSKEYMSVRTGVYKSNETYSKGKNKGASKPEGVFTKGKDKGKPRPRYNRTGDTKVILSLTGELEKGLEVMATEKGFGLGYPFEGNLNKTIWNEATYKKPIYSLTDGEKTNVIEIAQAFTNKQINE